MKASGTVALVVARYRQCRQATDHIVLLASCWVNFVGCRITGLNYAICNFVCHTIFPLRIFVVTQFVWHFTHTGRIYVVPLAYIVLHKAICGSNEITLKHRLWDEIISHWVQHPSEYITIHTLHIMCLRVQIKRDT